MKGKSPISTVLGAALVLMVLMPAAQADQHMASVARGAKIWAETCTHCHNSRDPKEFRDDQWRAILYHMRVRAGMTGQETRDVLEFFQNSN